MSSNKYIRFPICDTHTISGMPHFVTFCAVWNNQVGLYVYDTIRMDQRDWNLYNFSHFVLNWIQIDLKRNHECQFKKQKFIIRNNVSRFLFLFETGIWNSFFCLSVYLQIQKSLISFKLTPGERPRSRKTLNIFVSELLITQE